MRVSQFSYLKFLDKFNPALKVKFVQFLINRGVIEPKTETQRRLKNVNGWYRKNK